MRNLLAESMEVSTSSYYTKADGTKSDVKSYENVKVSILISDGIYRNYTISRSGFVGRQQRENCQSWHCISGMTFDENADYWMRISGNKTMMYKDDASFAKAIQAIQKRIK
jgi:hypothetical protein